MVAFLRARCAMCWEEGEPWRGVVASEAAPSNRIRTVLVGRSLVRWDEVAPVHTAKGVLHPAVGDEAALLQAVD